MYEHNDLKHYIKKENYGISFFSKASFDGTKWFSVILPCDMTSGIRKLDFKIQNSIILKSNRWNKMKNTCIRDLLTDFRVKIVVFATW